MHFYVYKKIAKVISQQILFLDHKCKVEDY